MTCKVDRRELCGVALTALTLIGACVPYKQQLLAVPRARGKPQEEGGCAPLRIPLLLLRFPKRILFVIVHSLSLTPLSPEVGLLFASISLLAMSFSSFSSLIPLFVMAQQCTLQRAFGAVRSGGFHPLSISRRSVTIVVL